MLKKPQEASRIPNTEKPARSANTKRDARKYPALGAYFPFFGTAGMIFWPTSLIVVCAFTLSSCTASSG